MFLKCTAISIYEQSIHDVHRPTMKIFSLPIIKFFLPFIHSLFSRSWCEIFFYIIWISFFFAFYPATAVMKLISYPHINLKCIAGIKSSARLSPTAISKCTYEKISHQQHLWWKWGSKKSLDFQQIYAKHIATIFYYVKGMPRWWSLILLLNM